MIKPPVAEAFLVLQNPVEQEGTILPEHVDRFMLVEDYPSRYEEQQIRI